MTGIDFKRVAKANVPQNKRMVRGKYQRFLDELMDLSPGVTACVEMQCKKDGYNATTELRRLAKKEGVDLGWSRNLDHTEFYYWVERPKAQPIRRTA
jgi:predicted amidohydrolase YtcJ